MTDHEMHDLLVLAAKAGGIRYDQDASIPKDGRAWWGLWLVYDDEPGQGARRYWRPHTRDGDALRLAAKLYLWEPIRLAHRLLGSPGCPDIYAATRLAVVLAAADIGRAACDTVKGTDFTLKEGDEVISRNWSLTRLMIVDVNWALRAAAVSLGGKSTVVWSVDNLRKVSDADRAAQAACTGGASHG